MPDRRPGVARFLSRISALLALATLAACGPAGEIECISTPPPSISSSPPTSAMVGSPYVYYVDSRHECAPFVCNNIDGLVLPPGAVIDDYYDSITWTPTEADVNRSVPFVIATEPDFCGNRATQSWSVYVSPESNPPRVTGVYPTGTNVPLTALISAAFSEPVDPLTVTTASFQVAGPSGVVAGSLQTSGSAVTFTPGAALPQTSAIRVRITTAVRDLSGLPLATDYVWSFTTGVAPDTTPPTVPAGLSATRVTASEVGLAWGVSTDDVALAGYRIYRDGSSIQSLSTLSAWDSGLHFDTAYRYTISAFDVSGNESAQSAPLDVRTLDLRAGNAASWGKAYRADGTFFARTVPDVAVVCVPTCVALDGVSAVAASGNRLLALANGAVWQWVPYLMSEVTGLSGGTGVTGGPNHSLAVLSDGSVWGWWDNAWGQLGDGTTDSASAPVQMLNVSQASAAAGGLGHTLVLRADGTVWATGGNWFGQLGDGTTADKTSPVQVASLSDVAAIAAGGNQSLALKSDGTVWSWGGTGYTAYSATPVQVAGLAGVTAIAQGYGFALAVRADGTVWAWGLNGSGQLGDGTTLSRPAPGQVSGLTNVVSVAAGDNHSVALKADGTVWAWGYNGDGQLGDGTTTGRLVPVQVTRIQGATSIAAGASASFAAR